MSDNNVLNRAALSFIEKNPVPVSIALQQHGPDWSLRWRYRNTFAGLMLGLFLLLWGGVAIGFIYVYPLLTGQFVLMQSLYGIPALLMSLLLLMVVLFCFFGSVELQKHGRCLKYFYGVAGLGVRRSFDLERYADCNVVNSKGFISYIPAALELYKNSADGKQHQARDMRDGKVYHALQLKQPAGDSTAAATLLLRTLPRGKHYSEFLYIAGFLLQRLGQKNHCDIG